MSSRSEAVKALMVSQESAGGYATMSGCSSVTGCAVCQVGRSTVQQWSRVKSIN